MKIIRQSYSLNIQTAKYIPFTFGFTILFHSKLLSTLLYTASYLTLNTNGVYQQHHTYQTPTQQQKTEIYLQDRTNKKNETILMN